jgi:hypothetical protein
MSKILLARRQQQVLRRWLREVETLSDTEEMIWIRELESGENLSEEKVRSVDLMNGHEGSGEFSSFRVGNEGRYEDLIYFQEVRVQVPNYQEGKGEERNSSKSLD